MGHGKAERRRDLRMRLKMNGAARTAKGMININPAKSETTPASMLRIRKPEASDATRQPAGGPCRDLSIGLPLLPLPSFMVSDSDPPGRG